MDGRCSQGLAPRFTMTSVRRFTGLFGEQWEWKFGHEWRSSNAHVRRSGLICVGVPDQTGWVAVHRLRSTAQRWGVYGGQRRCRVVGYAVGSTRRGLQHRRIRFAQWLAVNSGVTIAGMVAVPESIDRNVGSRVGDISRVWVHSPGTGLHGQ